jgi:transposase-like protein
MKDNKYLYKAVKLQEVLEKLKKIKEDKTHSTVLKKMKDKILHKI